MALSGGNPLGPFMSYKRDDLDRALRRLFQRLRQLEGRAFRPNYHLPEATGFTPELQPLHKWLRWIPEEWGICDVYVDHTPALRGRLKSYCVWVQPEVPPC